MQYSGAGGKLIHQKNQKQKILWHCPFKGFLEIKCFPSGSALCRQRQGILSSHWTTEALKDEYHIIKRQTLQKKPREMSQFGKKSAKVYHSLYSSTEQLQVALWTFMFIRFGLNNEKSILTLPLQSVPFLSLHL